jgi:pimeloyl-ACP methyl ester carboxylesterase
LFGAESVRRSKNQGTQLASNTKETEPSKKSIFKSVAGKKKILDVYDSVLSNWPVPCTTGEIPTSQGATFFIKSGKIDAPPIILLHGASSNATSWISDVAAYSQGYTVYAIDVPGDPGKSAESRPSWQGLGYAEWLDDVFTGLKIKKATLIGLSQGGWLALRYATYRPENIDKLVVLAPAGIVPTKPSFLLKAIFLSLLGKFGARQINRIVFGKQAIHPDAVAYMDLIMTHFQPRIEKEYIFTDQELQKLNLPVLLICGSEDAIRSPKEIVARMSKLLPHFRAEIIPNMGHVLVNLTDRILPFLRA